LSNTKLFRRDLLDKYQIRYPEEMPVGSDQPFTIEACLHADRISVLSDYEFYYSVRRRNARNITYASDELARLASTVTIMDFVAKLVDAGPRRDAIFVRHFDWELSKLVDDRFLDAPREVQEQVRAGVARLCDDYLTEPIRNRLRPESRVRLAVAEHGTREQLVDVIRQDAVDGVPPTVVEDGRRYAAYPGFRDAAASLPDSCFDVTQLAVEWAEPVDLMLAARARPLSDVLILTVRGARTAPGDRPRRPLKLRAGLVGGSTMTVTDDAGGPVTSVAFHVTALADRTAPRHVWSIDETSGAGDIAVRASRLMGRQRFWFVTSHGIYLATLTKNYRGQLRLEGKRVHPRMVISRLRGRLSKTRKSSG
jgi:hypothetical protein